MKLLLAGISTRAAASSAALSGFSVTSFDAYADLDQHPAVDARVLRRGFGAQKAVRAASPLPADAVAYLSNFENFPEAVAAFSQSRLLLGNTPQTLRRVRDPYQLNETLRCRGQAVLRLGGGGAGAWLVKPFASGGGHGIRPWKKRPIPRSCYLQEYVEGTPASAVFIADGRRAVIVGMSRQLSGSELFGAKGFQYCGNVTDTAFFTATLAARIEALVSVVTEEFELCGANSLDLIVRKGTPYVLEVNPRWSASMELMERAIGTPLFAAHVAGCRDKRLSGIPSMQASTQSIGKAIVYARTNISVGDTMAWLQDDWVRDVPRPGEIIAAGHPICTIFATGDTYHRCTSTLQTRATDIYGRVTPKVAVA